MHEIKVQIDSPTNTTIENSGKNSLDRHEDNKSMCSPDEQLDGEFNIFLKMFLAKEYYISQAGNRTNKVEIHLRSIAESPSVCVKGLS